jgi:hypothetical protein
MKILCYDWRIHYFFCALMLVLSFSSASAQQKDSVVHASTSSSPLGRYEIVQSTLAARWTFKVDRTCGQIFQYVSTKGVSGVGWEEMLILKLPKCNNDGKIRYQIFTSGIAARHTFLMNIENGKTWTIQTSKDAQGNEATAWVPFDD